jgi:DNA-binding NarL/FixJ family response regulator
MSREQSQADTDSTTAPAQRSGERSYRDSPQIVPLLFGRTKEQTFLREELVSAFDGHGRLVLVGGEAGIGKTALARDMTNRVRDLGAAILTGSCYDLTNTPPYGPWLNLFEHCARDSGLPAPPDAFASGQLPRVTDQAALFEEVRRFFEALAADRPTLVVLEDLHWADPASLDLLRHIGPYLRHWSVIVLATYRVEVLSHEVPFAQQLPALVRETEGRRLDLRRLDADALRSLVGSRYRLDEIDEDRLVGYLERHADGNPFFATELLRTLGEEGLLWQDGERWALGALDRVVVPSLLKQVIDGRVARLGESTRKLLAIAAVIGQEVPLALWAEVSDFAEQDLFEIVEQAVSAHLLEAERDGVRVRYVHALTREALYEGILPPRRRLWHRRVADVLMASPRADPDSVAFHLEESGDPDAWNWLVKAADRAQRAYAWLTAAERLRTAVDLLEGVEGQERSRCRLACRIGWLKRFSDPAGAIAAVDAAVRDAAAIDDSVMVAELGWVRGVLLLYSDRFRSGVAAMATAKGRLDALELMQYGAQAPSPIQAWFEEALPGTVSLASTDNNLDGEQSYFVGQQFRRGALIWQLASCGHYREVTEDDRQFVTRWDLPGAKGGVPAAIAFTYLALAIADAALGQPEKACTEWTRACELLLKFGHHAVIAFAFLNQLRDVSLTYDASDPLSRRWVAKEAEAALGRAGGALRPDVSPRVAWLSSLVLDGQWDEVDRILRASPSPGNAYLRREVTDAAALLARLRGEREIAWAHIRPLFPKGPETAPGDMIHQEGLFLLRLAADLCLDAGDLSGSTAWLSAHDAWLSWSASELGRADGHLGWARYHWAAGDAALTRASASAALTLAAKPDQPLVRLVAHRLLGEIETVAANQKEAEIHLTTALELANVCGVPFERALTLLALAELHAGRDAGGASVTLLEEVRRICVPLGTAPTLARADAVAARLALRQPSTANSVGLTGRELDVLRLLVAGRSNPEIAESLYISRDTARTHVANIFRKLDVSSRAEAVDHAHRLGLVSAFPSPST